MGGETFSINESGTMLRALRQNLVDHLEILHLLPLALGDALHMARIIDIPIRGLIGLRLLHETCEVNLTGLLSEVHSLGTVLNESVRGYLNFAKLFVGLVVLIGHSKLFSFAANNDTGNVHQRHGFSLT